MSDDNHHVTIEDLKALEERLRTHLDEREARLEERLKAHTEEQIERMETKLLTAFHGWASAMEIRVRTGDALARGMDERLSLLEERVSRLERGQK